VSALPVINSLGGETAEMIANYKAGVKYTAGNLASFKKALGEITSNTSRLPEMRRSILAMARNEFDAVPIYDSYVEFAMSLFPPPHPDGKPEPEEE
jgi:glycosyltransferase involved in cell wall biosynthesis